MSEQLLTGRRKLIVCAVALGMTLLLGLAGRMEGEVISATLMGLLAEYFTGNILENKLLSGATDTLVRSFGIKKFWMAISGLVIVCILGVANKVTGIPLGAALAGISGVYVTGNVVGYKLNSKKDEVS